MDSVSENLARSEALLNDRQPMLSLWQQIRDYINPPGQHFEGETVEGELNREHVFDSTAEQACGMLAASIQSTITPPSSAWMRQRPADELVPTNNHDEQVWFEDADERMLAVFAAPVSRFSIAQYQSLVEFVAYGQGCYFIKDRPGNVPLFSARPIASLAWADDENDEPGELVWRFKLSAAQAIARWGNKVGDKIAKLAEDPKRRHEKTWFRHYLAPRATFDRARRDRANMPLLSAWISEEDKKEIDVGGFHEMPYIVSRWNRTPGSAYAYGSGAVALPDVKMLQRIAENTIEAAELAMEPPLQVADDGIAGPPDLRRAAWNTVRSEYMASGRDGIKPIQLGVRPDIGIDFQQRIQMTIERAFLKQLMQMERDARMTATHVLSLEQEQARGRDPLSAHIETEQLGPTHRRVFGIMQRGGMFSPAPPSLQNKAIRAELVSPTARSQRLGAVGAIIRRLELMGPMIDRDPSIAASQDWPGTWDYVGRALGVPSVLDRPREEVEAEAAAAAEAAGAAEANDQLASLMAAAGKGAPAFDKIDEISQPDALAGQVGDGGNPEDEEIADAA